MLQLEEIQSLELPTLKYRKDGPQNHFFFQNAHQDILIAPLPPY